MDFTLNGLNAEINDPAHTCACKHTHTYTNTQDGMEKLNNIIRSCERTGHVSEADLKIL